jgi:hypothetical protein
MTNTAKHTPLWYISTCPKTGRRFLCEYGVDNNIAELFGTKEQDATIAAALELLEALQEIIKALELAENYGFDYELKVARTVIAQVDGRE